MTIFIRSSRAPRKMANDPRSKTTDLAYIFRHFDLHDLIFFGHFKNVSVCYRKMTEKIPRAQTFLFGHIKSYFLRSKVILSRFLGHKNGPSHGFTVQNMLFESLCVSGV